MMGWHSMILQGDGRYTPSGFCQRLPLQSGGKALRAGSM
ncbi:hypothetical protein C4K17_4448 [Pseudomonas chlororaphis subsp. aurantiaca]|nr:hypothetical protein C4K17_4448 [Pseudomonas chlororaphis subsp. aurantiaca]